MAITESNVYGLWVGQQSAQGTEAGSAAFRVVQVAGDIDLNREDGSENYSDGDRFGQTLDYVNILSGQGEPVLHAQPDIVAFICWLFFGEETFTAAAGTNPPKYEFTPGTTTGLWSTWWKRVGLSQVVRQKFVDCKITQLKIEGSTANKIVKITPQVTSLDPGIAFDTDPNVDFATQRPFLYTEAHGTIKINNEVFSGQTQFALTIDDGQQAIQTDSVTYNDFVAGNATITMDGPTLLLDADALAHYNTVIYGTATPTDDAKPLSTVTDALGSYEIEFVRGVDTERESLKITIPAVKWNPNVPIAPSPDGGAVEINLAGAMRKDPDGADAITITVETGANGSTASHD